MPVSRALRRLLGIRNLEEEQRLLTLESAMGELNRLKQALAAAGGRDRRGRKLIETGARSGQLPDRLAGLEEMRAARRIEAVLAPRIATAESNVARLRQEFLEKRVERRQAETLIEEQQAREAVVAGRRTQQELDDRFGARSRTDENQAEPLKPAAPSASVLARDCGQ